ncbi:DUF2953 domain-containing protein [Lachnoclostridium sp.]|nr:DUF2953 domain-containing protein [Lachnoclostridium sp.]
MLHILLLILKIIWIVIAVLLGLLLLVVLVVLFVPIRYRFEGKKYSDIVVRGKVTWAFGLVHLRVLYLQEKLSIVLRIAGYRFYDNDDSSKKKHKKKKRKKKEYRKEKQRPEDVPSDIDKKQLLEDKSNDSRQLSKELEDKKLKDKKIEDKKIEDKKLEDDLPEVDFDLESKDILTKDKVSNLSEDSSSIPGSLNTIDEAEDGESFDNDKNAGENTSKKISFLRRFISKIKQLYRKIKNVFTSVWNKIKNLKNVFHKLKDKLSSIRNLLQGLWEKKRKVVAYFKLDENKAGMKLGLSSIKKLLKHIKPTKAKGYIHFGTGDPASTGQILGVASVFYGYYGKYLKVVPDFEEEVLEGELFIKGRIRLFNLLIIGIKLLRDKNFKRLIKNTKLLKEELL